MKKILSLLALLMLCIVGANAETVAKYALSVDDTFTSGQTVEVKNGDAVVATITYGETGGADFKAAKSYTGIEGYTAFTEGNGVNGNKEGGTFYTITPTIDATISVAVCLNADKAFYIEEDGTALEDYNGIKVSEKFYGTFEFEATADKAYKVYCAGSKLGFFGFELMKEQSVDLTAEKTALEALISKVEAFGINMLADDVEAAREALNDPNATAESLTTATATLKANVIADMLEALDLVSQFATTYGYSDARMEQRIEMAKTLVEAGDLDQLSQMIPMVGSMAKPKIEDALTKIAGYAETMDNEAFNAALAEAQEAAEGTDYILTVQKLEAAASAFLVAAQEFVAKVDAIDTEGKEKGEELAAALAAAKAAMADETKNIVDKGDAIKALVQAYRAFEEANQLVIESMTIVGDFLGLETEDENFNPANGWAMVQDADNPAIWSLTKEGVVVEAKQYRYKATANGVYGVYELPAEGNQDFVFGTEEYPAGTYNLTFTADTENHKLTLVVDKQAEAAEFLILTLDGRADITEGKALLVEAADEVSANVWIKKEAAGARGFAKVPAAEIMEGGVAMFLIEDADLTEGKFSFYADKEFEIAKVTLLENPDAATGEQIYPVVETEAVYTIMGSVKESKYTGEEEAGFFGTMWDAAANEMAKGDDGLYTKTFENIYLIAQNYIQYQAAKDGEAIGSKAWKMVEEDGMYNIVFTFNPEDNTVTCDLQKPGVEPMPVYTLVGSVKLNKY